VGNTLHGASNILMIAVQVAALVGVFFAWRRRRREALVLAAGAVALILIVALMVELGYGGSPRFLFPAAGLVCVLAGYGVASLARAAGGGWRSTALLLLILAASIPLFITRIGTFSDRADDISLRAQLQDDLDRAVEAAGGGGRLRRLGHPRINPSFAHQLAWDLDVPMGAVGPLIYPALLFDGPQTRVSPGASPRIPSATNTHVRVTRLASVGGWLAVTVKRVPPSQRPKH
jgi:hypothetical protein